MRIKSEFDAATTKTGTPDDRFEPAVRDLMSTELFTMFKDDSLRALKDVFQLKTIRHVPIVDDDNRLVGLMTQRDFLRLAVSKLAHVGKEEIDDVYSNVKLSSVMGRKITTIRPDAPLSSAAQIMLKHKYGCLPVVDGETLVGIITEADFVAAFLRWNVQVTKS